MQTGERHIRIWKAGHSRWCQFQCEATGLFIWWNICFRLNVSYSKWWNIFCLKFTTGLPIHFWCSESYIKDNKRKCQSPKSKNRKKSTNFKKCQFISIPHTPLSSDLIVGNSKVNLKQWRFSSQLFLPVAESVTGNRLRTHCSDLCCLHLIRALLL